MQKVILATALLTAIVAYFWFKNMEASDSLNWPSVNGKILEIYINEESDWRRSQSTGIPRKVTKYAVVVKYVYSVNGNTYFGNRMRIVTKRYRTKSEATKRIEGYSVGQIVPVYFDPKSVDKSVLVRG